MTHRKRALRLNVWFFFKGSGINTNSCYSSLQVYCIRHSCDITCRILFCPTQALICFLDSIYSIMGPEGYLVSIFFCLFFAWKDCLILKVDHNSGWPLIGSMQLLQVKTQSWQAKDGWGRKPKQVVRIGLNQTLFACCCGFVVVLQTRLRDHFWFKKRWHTLTQNPSAVW